MPENANNSIFIYDTIGDEGVTSMEVINRIQSVESDEIHVRINSPGGSVFEGFAILQALLNSGKKVITHIDGVAASMASIIALAGDEVEIADFAMLMIHNSHIPGLEEDEIEDESVKTLIRSVNKSLEKIYSKRTSLSKDKIKQYLETDTWITAEQALEEGFVTKINETQERKVSAKGKSVDELFKHFTKKISAKTKETDMKLIKAEVGVNESDNEQAVVDAIKAVKKEKDSLGKKVEAKEEEVKNLKAKLKEYEDKEAQEQEKQAKELVEAAFKESKISAEQKDKWITFAQADYESTKAILDDLPKNPKLSDAAAGGGEGKDNPTVKRTPLQARLKEIEEKKKEKELK